MTESARYSRVLLGNNPLYLETALDGAVRVLGQAPWLGVEYTTRNLTADELVDARPLCPVVPTKIIGIGRNYKKHAEEMNYTLPTAPLMFFKPPSSLLAPGGIVVLPPESERVDYEGEICVVIGRSCRRITEAQAMDSIFGYTLACDITARDIQKSDNQWTRGKGFDTFCPVGPDLVRVLDLSDTQLSLEVNGTKRQNGSTADMLFGVSTLISYISQAMTLEAGDVILTGTPEGVGPLSPGDRVSVLASGLNSLHFDVKAES